MVYKKAKEFIDNFKFPIDYDNSIRKLDDISRLNCEENGSLSENVIVKFEDMPEFGVGARVKNGNIRFNKTRIETMLNLGIDCLSDSHLNWMWSFYNKFNLNEEHSIYEESLYNFMKKYIEDGAERYFDCCGSYKLISYELLECIFHENAHIFQSEYDKYLSGEFEYPNDEKSMLLIFTEAFNMIYHKLKKNNIEFEYKRNNYIFPIEFDARYEAMIKMNKLKNRYYKNDKIFSKYLVYSNIIPEDLDIVKTSEEIFETYEYLFDIYSKEIGRDYNKTNDYLQKNKERIVNIMRNRYKEMLAIVSENKQVNEFI